MSEYKILCCGSNGSYQLGIGNEEDQNILQPVLFKHEDGSLKESIDAKPIKISSGGNHTFILLSSGQLYSAGDNTYGQCGQKSNSEYIHEFTLVGGKGWVDVCCGWEFSILMNDAQEIYVCGLGLKGELGLGQGVTKSDLTRAAFKFPNPVVDIKSSINHVIVRLANNELYGWGNCRKGQLGSQPLVQSSTKLKPRGVIWEPEPLDFKTKTIRAYDLGRDCTVIVDDSSTIEIFGKGAESFQPPDEIIDLKSMWSSNHYALRDRHDQLLIKSRGNNSHGQLYPGSSIQVQKYVVGSEHGLVLAADSKVYAWGWGEHGNCGKHSIPVNHDKIEDQVTFGYPNCLYDSNLPVILIEGGCATSWVGLQTK